MATSLPKFGVKLSLKRNLSKEDAKSLQEELLKAIPNVHQSAFELENFSTYDGSLITSFILTWVNKSEAQKVHDFINSNKNRESFAIINHSTFVESLLPRVPIDRSRSFMSSLSIDDSFSILSREEALFTSQDSILNFDGAETQDSSLRISPTETLLSDENSNQQNENSVSDAAICPSMSQSMIFSSAKLGIEERDFRVDQELGAKTVDIQLNMTPNEHDLESIRLLLENKADSGGGRILDGGLFLDSENNILRVEFAKKETKERIVQTSVIAKDAFNLYINELLDLSKFKSEIDPKVMILRIKDADQSKCSLDDVKRFLENLVNENDDSLIWKRATVINKSVMFSDTYFVELEHEFDHIQARIRAKSLKFHGQQPVLLDAYKTDVLLVKSYNNSELKTKIDSIYRFLKVYEMDHKFQGRATFKTLRLFGPFLLVTCYKGSSFKLLNQSFQIGQDKYHAEYLHSFELFKQEIDKEVFLENRSSLTPVEACSCIQARIPTSAPLFTASEADLLLKDFKSYIGSRLEKGKSNIKMKYLLYKFSFSDSGQNDLDNLPFKVTVAFTENLDSIASFNPLNLIDYASEANTTMPRLKIQLETTKKSINYDGSIGEITRALTLLKEKILAIDYSDMPIPGQIYKSFLNKKQLFVTQILAQAGITPLISLPESVQLIRIYSVSPSDIQKCIQILIEQIMVDEFRVSRANTDCFDAYLETLNDDGGLIIEREKCDEGLYKICGIKDSVQEAVRRIRLEYPD